MLRDIEGGHPTEGDHILGDLLNRAKRFGIPHPLLSLAYTNVKAYEERRLSGRDQKK
ncbi:ketopantoate reductase C-terminal domain-containing protein [Bartonella apihabitans]|nr:ketopantoate reductase C-terminal domain-containing protein [Bartonella apihabitans]